MTTQKENAKKEKAEKSPQTWLSSYVKGKDKSCASMVTSMIMSGANEKQLIDSATAFNKKQGKSAKCLMTKGSLKQHVRWLESKGIIVNTEKNNYRIAA